MKVLGIDPRALLTAKIKPPKELPFVSRRALARVKDRIDIPTDCPHCGGRVSLVNNSFIYGREFGDWPYAYACEDRSCNSYVGVHPKTDLPLGTLANKATREARRAAKELFRSVAHAKFDADRNASYDWLSSITGIPREVCHFGMFSIEQCDQVKRAITPAKQGGAA